MSRKNLMALIVASVCVMVAVPALAFLEGTPDVIERNVQNLIRQAKNGDSAAMHRLHDELNQYETLDLRNHSSGEIMNYIRRLERAGQFPSYVFERGSYTYDGGMNYMYLIGRNISMYSLPLLESATRIARLNTSGTDYLEYLGEWKPQKGDPWVFARMRESGQTGWIEKRSTRRVTNMTFRQLIPEMQAGLQGYNITTVRTAQRTAEAINTDAVNYSRFTRAVENNILSTVKAANGGNYTAKNELAGLLKTWQGVASKSDLARKSWDENDAYVQQLIKGGRVDGTFLRAGYKYDESGIFIYTPESATVRAKPDSESASIMTTKAGQALRYLGERLTRNGVKFYLADDMRGTVGWISERVVEIVPIDAAKVFRQQIEEGMTRKSR
ncbi:MAG: SH3 domain-containing protein [Synergistaceae bacterium]|nr:SH3 domain-containing protein [Synergistaceae bacterium]